MADAVYRAEHGIALSEDFAQPFAILLDTPVMMNKGAIGPQDQCPQMGNKSRSSAHINDPGAAQVHNRASSLVRVL